MQKDFSNLTILYVEDEALIRQNAVEYLGRIITALNGLPPETAALMMKLF